MCHGQPPSVQVQPRLQRPVRFLNIAAGPLCCLWRTEYRAGLRASQDGRWNAAGRVAYRTGMEKHLTLVSALFIALGILGMAVAFFVFVAIAGGGWLSGEREAIFVTSSVATLVAGFIAALSLPTLIAGVGLLRRRPWSRTLGLVVAALQLTNMPLGTVFGVYAMWVLLQEETGRLLISS